MKNYKTAAELAHHFLSALERLNITDALSVFADEAVQEMPFAPGNFPKRLVGKAALERQYGGLPDAYESMTFPISRTYESPRGDWAVIEYRGSIAQRDGRRYDNTYVGVYLAENGKLVHFTEYFDPTVLLEAFGNDLADTFSLDRDSQ